MSCFESSKFVKNPNVFSIEVLELALKKLNWEFTKKQQVLTVTKIPGHNLHGEYAMRINAGNVEYNSYYLKNALELVGELRKTFESLNVIYAKAAVIKEFEKQGFSLKKNYDFVPNQQEVDSFYMVAYSKLENEDERRTEIEFKILSDGTVVSDSSYIPQDVHKLADLAMENLDKDFGTQRREGIEIIRKPVPVKYQNKSYCTVNNKIKAKN